MPYLQLIVFLPAIVLAFLFARRIRRRLPCALAIAIPLALITLVILGHRIPRFYFLPPISWAVSADLNPLFMPPAIAVLFGILLPRLPQRRSRRAAATGVLALLLYYGPLPAVLTLAVRPSLASTPTRLDARHVCLQSHAYTCGPAAAVTCLARLNVPAQEGSIAIAARCAPAIGTDGVLLAAALSEKFPPLRCTYRYAASIDDLTAPAIVEVILPDIGGHYVAILQINPDSLLIGDPLSGQYILSRQEFLAQWKHTAITFTQ